MEQHTPAVVGLFRPQEQGRPMEPLPRVEVIAGVGFAGDRKAKPGSKRQVLLFDRETIEAFGFQPGDLDENITTSGLALSQLQRGQQVRIGDVLLEVTIPRPTCHKLDELRPGLGAELEGRRGMMSVVLRGGEIRVGDAIEIVDAGEAAD